VTRTVFLLSTLTLAGLHAETGRDAWLRYASVQSPPALPAVAVALGDSAVIATAQNELIRGVRGMAGHTLRADRAIPQESAIVVGTLADIRRAAPQWNRSGDIAADGSFEDMEVADLLNSADGLLAFQAVHGGLDGGIGWSLFLGETLLNLPNGGAATGPQSFHDLEFQLGEFGARHHVSYRRLRYYYMCSKCQGFSSAKTLTPVARFSRQLTG